MKTLTAKALAGRPLPDPDDCHDKDDRGRVLIVAGGAEVPGAALLAGLASLRAGAGKLQFAAPGQWAPLLAFAAPEARVVKVASTQAGDFSKAALPRLIELAGGVDAVVIGPGMTDEAIASPLVLGALRAEGRAGYVIDAAALTGLRDHAQAVRSARAPLVFTPHCGEMAALLGATKSQVEAEPVAAAKQAARAFGAVVALKGETTHIVAPDGEAWAHRGGAVGLGTSGSGDVLAGLAGGLLARGASPMIAAQWAVFAHAAAGRRLTAKFGKVGFLAREILAEIPRILQKLHAKARR